ncbi:MAG: class I SAM-dependent methyltransferase, partial [Sphingomonadaceae bacterium]
PEARLFGLDISEAMLETARANVAKAGLSGRIHFAAADATAFDPLPLFGEAAFDRIFQSYTLSMIPDWRGAIAEAVRHLKTDGKLHVVDFGQQERLPAPFRRMLHAWLAQFHVEPRAGLREAAEAAAQNRPVDFASLYRGYAWSAVVR